MSQIHKDTIKVTQGPLQEHIKAFYKEFPYAIKMRVYVTPMMNMAYNGICDPIGGYVKLSLLDLVRVHKAGRLKELVYHELGHCGLDLAHAEDNDRSIMAPGMQRKAPGVGAYTIREMKYRHKKTCEGSYPQVRDQLWEVKTSKHLSCIRRFGK